MIRDGWYETGDMALIDDDGFIHITGRISRFSKIGGEMVPHLKVEEELLRLLGSDDESELRAAVTAVPDKRKGERLIVLHVPMDKSPQDVRQGLSAAGLPNIFLPSADSFCEVEEIPVLGTGKLDLKRLKQLALERFGEPSAGEKNGETVGQSKEGTTEAGKPGGVTGQRPSRGLRPCPATGPGKRRSGRRCRPRSAGRRANRGSSYSGRGCPGL